MTLWSRVSTRLAVQCWTNCISYSSNEIDIKLSSHIIKSEIHIINIFIFNGVNLHMHSDPNPAGGAYDAPPDSLVGWEGGHPLPIPSPLDAFGISIWPRLVWNWYTWPSSQKVGNRWSRKTVTKSAVGWGGFSQARHGKVSMTICSPGMWHDECLTVSRPQLPPRQNGDAHISQVGWQQTMKTLEGDHSQLEGDSLTHRKPVKLMQHWCNMIKLSCSGDDTHCCYRVLSANRHCCIVADA